MLFYVFVIADDDQTMGVARAVDVNQSLSATPVLPARMHPWGRAAPDRDAQKLHANALSHTLTVMRTRASKCNGAEATE